MAGVDAKLADSLKHAKTNPMFFTFVAKGNEGKLLVDKKKINAKDADTAKKACGGGTIYKGRCQAEEAKMIFHVGKEVPAALNALTKKIIKQDAGLTLDVEYRFAADLAAEEGQAEVPAEVSSPTAAVPPPPAPPPTATPASPSAAPPSPQSALPTAPDGADVIKRLNGQSANIKTALAGPDKARVQTLFVSVNGLIKNKDFAGAHTALDELERLLAKPTAAPTAASAAGVAAPPEPVASPASQAPANDAALAAEWERRVIALEPTVMKAHKTRAKEAKWLNMFMSAQDLGSDGDFTKALVVLDRLEKLLNEAPKVSEALAAFTARWEVARDVAVANLRKQIKNVLATKHRLAGEAELELKAVIAQLGGQVATLEQATVMEKYLADDDVVASVCKLAFDLKTPLLKVLRDNAIKLTA